MTEVYKALMALGCEWLQLSSYRIKCKWRPNAPRGSSFGKRPTPGTMPGFGIMPSAGGETLEAAFNKQGSMDTDGTMEMDVEKDKKRGAATNSLMKVVAGDDGHFVPVPNLSTTDYSIKIGLTLYIFELS